VWRNNSGVLFDNRGVPVRFGLGNVSRKINRVFKSSDLIGLTKDGRFVAIEVKQPNWKGVRTPEERAQETFINVVKVNNGLAGFARSVEEAVEICLL